MDGTLRRMQERGLSILAQSEEGFQFTNTFFPYTSAEIGPHYVQAGAVMENGNWYSNACGDMDELITGNVVNRAEVRVISGGESRDWIFSGVMATRLEKRHTMIYKDGKTVGADMNDELVLPVADLNNEGSSPRDLWVPAIIGAGGRVTDIVFYVDRMEGGVQVMKDLGLESHAVVPLDAHAWDYLQKEGVVTEEVYRNLRARGTSKEERDAWAVAMLRSDAGLETLAELIKDDKSFPKAVKILDKGYPDMKKELVERLRKIDGDLASKVLLAGAKEAM